MTQNIQTIDVPIAEPFAEPLVPPSQTPYVERPHGPVGRSEDRIDGPEKVLGTALYGADLFYGRADCFVSVVRSEPAHAEIVAVDPSAALKMPGVLGVYTHRDVRGTNRQGLIVRDHPVLAESRVLFRGDAIAVVVATSERTAEDARRAVRVDYRPLPVVADMDAALAPDAPRLHPDGNIMGGKRIRKGDADAALAAADVIVSESFCTQTVDHAFLDLEAGIAHYDGRTLTIHVSGQWVHEERRLIALALGLPLESVRIICPATGGAFGGREDISIQIYLGIAAIQHPGKTVALRYSREESMRARHKRHAMRIYYTVGATRDGLLTAAKITVFSDEGAYRSTGPAVCRKAASHATGPYRIPNVSVDVYGVFTNNNPTGAMRGFGACQMAIAYEGMMDRLAARLGIDRLEVRRRNLIRSGDAVTTGQRIPIATAVECLDAAVRRLRQCPPPRPTDPHKSRTRPPALPPHLRRGVGYSVICFGLGYGDGFPDASRARVGVSDQGRIQVFTGGVEYGQGLITMAAQVAAEELGVSVRETDVVWADTEQTFESGSSSATRQTYFTGNAIRLAASELKEQLLDIASKLLGVHPHELELRDGCVVGRFDPARSVPLAEVVAQGRARGYSLEATALFKPRTVCEDFDTGQSPRAFITYLFGSHIAEVLVDIETGEVRVDRYIACHDVGRAINPQSVAGQMAGGATQGIGMALMEEVVNRDGRIANPNFTDYILPTFRDIPPVECVILENDDPGGPFGARGIGEPPLIAATPAVLSAIADAIGVHTHTTPCTPQRVWELLHPDEAAVPPDARFSLAPPHARLER
ncbi:MAG: xanthine dehydrogenase family protein molybdopterin-binding subunit [Phycisphaerae bacterium]|nr:xanthine dehydrogenase family protein molybdopterin-binding subunit [Phycisphaerae bacterium]